MLFTIDLRFKSTYSRSSRWCVYFQQRGEHIWCVDENLPMQNVFTDEHFFHEFAAANYFTLLPLCCCTGQHAAPRRAAMYRCSRAHFIHIRGVKDRRKEGSRGNYTGWPLLWNEGASQSVSRPPKGLRGPRWLFFGRPRLRRGRSRSKKVSTMTEYMQRGWVA